MSLDLYTQNVSLSQKARFWGDFVSSLKGNFGKLSLFGWIQISSGNADLCAGPEPRITNWYASITETIPPTYPGLRQEFGKLENLMWGQRAGSRAPTPVMPDANNRWGQALLSAFTLHPLFRIHTVGYNYCPVHTEIYGTYRNQARRGY